MEKVLEHVYRFERLRDNDFSHTMIVIATDSGLVIYNCHWMTDMLESFKAITAQEGIPDTVRAIILPNNFHHMHVKRFLEHFPEAKTYASEEAMPRLKKQGHANLIDVKELPLPENMKVYCCEGTKTGEVWIKISQFGKHHYLVCDAFFNMDQPIKGFKGMVLKFLDVYPGPKVSKTYQWLAVKNADKYKGWLAGLFQHSPPESVIVSHGKALTVSSFHKQGGKLGDILFQMTDNRVK